MDELKLSPEESKNRLLKLKESEDKYRVRKSKSKSKATESQKAVFDRLKQRAAEAKVRMESNDVKKIIPTLDFQSNYKRKEVYIKRRGFLKNATWKSFKDMIIQVGNEYMINNELFVIDDNNEEIYKIISYYFTCNETFVDGITLPKEFCLEKSLLLFGAKGTGKTLAIRIINEISKFFKGDISFNKEVSARKIPIEFSDKDNGGGGVIQKYITPRVLYINDFGLEPKAANYYSMTLNCLDSILYARHDLEKRRGRKTILCTNILTVTDDKAQKRKDITALYAMYDSRTVDRIFEHYNLIAFNGINRRLNKKKNNL
jgi:DNA replication protein DnaC